MSKPQHGGCLTAAMIQRAIDEASHSTTGPDIEFMSTEEYEQRKADLAAHGKYWPYGIGRPSSLP